ncbi:hypothetical protein B8A43_21625, partial [Pseudomonas aeruginosa]|uniref:hypothetical protein n=1 Tax=Pseudomonas aeruginosa TaxID=287 RepID=UPI000BCD435E
EFLYEVGGFIGEFDKHGGSFWYRILDQVVLDLDENGTTATENGTNIFDQVVLQDPLPVPKVASHNGHYV